MEAEAMELLQRIFRSYKRSASKLRDGAELLASGSLQISMSWKKDENLEITFKEEPPLVRYAALLRPFMSSDSPIELTAVWNILSSYGLVDEATCNKADLIFASTDNLGIGLIVNEKKMTAREIYYAYAEGQFFGEDPGAKLLLEQLLIGPMQQMVVFLFHSACQNYSNLVYFILEEILKIEQANHQLQIQYTSNPKCIYCLTQDGDFGPEEHVIPEAFGNDELVIRGAVCKSCNNHLSQLDQFLSEFEGLSLLRVLYVDLTKKGKFPRAKFRDFEVEKMKPREIRFTSRSGHRVFKKKQALPDGTYEFSVTTTGRKPLDVHTLGRSLFKIGLGLVAHDKGTESACDSRFDCARSYIHGTGTMPNNLFVSKNVTPSPFIRTSWQTFVGTTIVILDFFGVCFAFNLEESPFELPDAIPDGLFQELWLGSQPM